MHAIRLLTVLAMDEQNRRRIYAERGLPFLIFFARNVRNREPETVSYAEHCLATMVTIITITLAILLTIKALILTGKIQHLGAGRKISTGASTRPLYGRGANTPRRKKMVRELQPALNLENICLFFLSFSSTIQ